MFRSLYQLCTQGSLLVRLGGLIWDARNWTGISHVQHKHLIFCTMSLALGYPFEGVTGPVWHHSSHLQDAHTAAGTGIWFRLAFKASQFLWLLAEVAPSAILHIVVRENLLQFSDLTTVALDSSMQLLGSRSQILDQHIHMAELHYWLLSPIFPYSSHSTNGIPFVWIPFQFS